MYNKYAKLKKVQSPKKQQPVKFLWLYWILTDFSSSFTGALA